MKPPSPSHRRALLLLALALALALSGCTSPRDALGTNSSPCFRALAVAKDAVGGRGVYDGVRYLAAQALVSALHRAEHAGARPPRALAEARDAVCAVNYRGRFSSGAVRSGWPVGRERGRFAVVAVDAKSDAVLGTLVLYRPLLRFSKVLA